MKMIEILQMTLLVLFFLITTFLAFGTKIWLRRPRPFSKLQETKITQLSTSKIDFAAHGELSIRQISEMNKCGKKIIVTEFIDKQIKNYSRRAWEDYVKAWIGMAVIALIILCSQMRSYSKDITLPEILHLSFNTFVSTLISYGLFIYVFKLFFEFWLLKSQVHDCEDVLE